MYRPIRDPKLSSDQYVSKVNDFMREGLDKDIPQCPVCDADFESWIEQGEAHIQDPYARQTMVCAVCKAMWVAEYKLIGYYDLQGDHRTTAYINEVKQNA